VQRRECQDGNVPTHIHSLVGLYLRDPPKTGAAEHPAQPHRHDQQRLTSQEVQRRNGEMVAMRV